jgi:TonB family protein
MRNPEGEGPRGPSGDRPDGGDPAPKWSPSDRPDWWDEKPKLPWYKQVSRKQLYWTFAAIAFIHVMAGLGFMQDVKVDPIDTLRRKQKTVVIYSLLPVCPLSAKINTVKPTSPLIPPPGLVARDLTGSVGLGLKLNDGGKVIDVCLKQSSGNDGFDAAVYASARAWTFAQKSAVPEFNLVRVDFAQSDQPGSLKKYAVLATTQTKPQENK